MGAMMSLSRGTGNDGFFPGNGVVLAGPPAEAVNMETPPITPQFASIPGRCEGFSEESSFFRAASASERVARPLALAARTDNRNQQAAYSRGRPLRPRRSVERAGGGREPLKLGT